MNRSIKELENLLYPICLQLELDEALNGDKMNSLKVLKDKQESVRKVLFKFFEIDDSDISIEELISRLSTYLKNKRQEELKEVVAEGKDLSDNRLESLAEAEKLFRELMQKYSYIDIDNLQIESIISLYKHRKDIDKYLNGRATKKLKKEYETFKKINGEQSEEALEDLLKILNIMCTKYNMNLETAISEMKLMSIASISEGYIEILNSHFTKLKDMIIRAEEKNLQEEQEKINAEKEAKRKLEEQERIKKEEEKKKADELARREKERNEFLKPIDKKDGICEEFNELLSEISNTSMAKENILPFFLHIYSKDEGNIFDFISKEKLEAMFKMLKQYEKLEKRNAKIFIFSNKSPEIVQEWISKLQDFAENIGMNRCIEGGIAKYGSYFCDLEGKVVPMAKMDENLRKKVSKIFSSIFITDIGKKYIDDSEKDFLKIEFPEELGKPGEITNYRRTLKFIRKRKDALEVLGYQSKNKIDFDIILLSQARAKERITEYCNTKFIIEKGKGISIGVSKFDEMLEALNNKILEKRNTLEK